MKKYFSFDGETFLLHTTAEEAKAAAELNLKCVREDAWHDCWPDETESICWGEVKESAQVVSSTPTCQAVECDCAARHVPYFAEDVEYELVEVKNA